MKKIICRFSYSGCEEVFDTLDDAIETLDNEICSCCDDEELAANIHEVLCDLLEAANGDCDIEDCCDIDDHGNYIFER